MVKGSFRIFHIFGVLVMLICISLTVSQRINNKLRPPRHKCDGKIEFTCEIDGSCIPNDYVCNFKRDCPDGSDEFGCDLCTFENTTCIWNIVPPNVTQTVSRSLPTWQRPLRASEISRRHPEAINTDHTNGTGDGWYIFVNVTISSIGWGSFGREDHLDLLSSTITETTERCSLAFWYICSDDKCELSLEREQNSTKRTIWRFSDVTDYATDSWNQGIVHLGALKNATLRFKARTRTFPSKNGILGLDDVEFLNCRLPELPNPGSKWSCNLNKEFMCDRGQCIPFDRFCDYGNDCNDRSDEKPENCEVFPGRCDFENGTICNGWELEEVNSTDRPTFVTKSDFKICIVEKMSGVRVRKPVMDHTFFSDQGKYLCIDGQRNMEKKARLVSFTIRGDSSACKVRFWYNIIGNHTLHVLKRINYKPNGTELLETFSFKTDAYDWARGEVLLSNAADRRNFKWTPIYSKSTMAMIHKPLERAWRKQSKYVVFEADLTKGEGTVSLDDLSLSYTCEITDELLPGEKPDLSKRTPCIPGKFQCHESSECISETLVCNFISDCSDNSDELECGTCDFQTGWCGWNTIKDMPSEWKRLSLEFNPYSSNYNVPLSDHTYQNKSGYFLYPYCGTECDFRNQDENKLVAADLKSPLFARSGPKCQLSFWYYMNDTKGHLSLFVAESASAFQHKLLWNQSVNALPEWRNQTIDIGLRNDFYLRFTSQLPALKKFELALDDIAFENCGPDLRTATCGDLEWKCTEHHQCIDIWKRCDNKIDCDDGTDEDGCDYQPGDCDFTSENWMEECGWTNVKEWQDFKWQRGTTPRSRRTGPQRPLHIDASAPYLFVDSSKQSKGDKAAIASPLFEANVTKCYLRFSYNMYGSRDLGKLFVFIKGERGQIYPVWFRRGNQGPEWHHAAVPVTHSQAFRVIFQAEIGHVGLSDIAIDNIQFTPDCGRRGPIMPRCHLGYEFSCGQVPRKCIPFLWHCDGVQDCPNKLDENMFCGRLPSCNGTQCTMMRSKKTECLPEEYLCDGITQCQDGQDEYLCGECPPSLCLNGGTCEVRGNEFPTCRCTGGFSGYRCKSFDQATAEALVEKDKRKKKNAMIGGIAGAIVGVALIVMIIALILRKFRFRYFSVQQRNGDVELS